MIRGVKLNHWFFWMLLAVTMLAAGLSHAEPFGYVYKGTHMWVPGTSTGQLLDLPATFGVVPDLLVVRSYKGSVGADFRLRLIQTKYTVGVGLSDDTNSDLIATSMSAAQKDTLFDQEQGLDSVGATLIPAGGASFYGSFYWALAPAATDTILIDAYDSVN